MADSWIQLSKDGDKWKKVKHITTLKPFSFLKKINPIWWWGNEDDRNPPFDYAVNNPQWLRELKWTLRNPLHNLTFFVPPFGFADQTFIRIGLFPTNVFNPEKGWNICFGYCKWWPMFFISYINGSFKFYIGHRERGNFGIKLNF